MTVNTVINALQEFNLTIPGIASAPTVPPNTLDGFDFPCTIVVPGTSRWRGAGGLGANWRANRVYTVTFYLLPTSPSAENTVDLFNIYLDWIDTVGDAYRNLARLGDPAVGLLRRHDNATESVSDGGPAILTYLSDADIYYGFILQVPIEELAT